jgi:hypothetical protein
MACRGTGRVISHLGGTPSTVECPWCEGSGLRPAEIDAQEHWGPPTGEQRALPGEERKASAQPAGEEG